MALAARRQLAAAFVLLERIRSAGAHRARHPLADRRSHDSAQFSVI
jgi:hypothetical protein